MPWLLLFVTHLKAIRFVLHFHFFLIEVKSFGVKGIELLRPGPPEGKKKVPSVLQRTTEYPYIS